MKKALILFLIAIIGHSSSAQEYCKFLPYYYNNSYGLANDKQEKIVEPKYKRLEIINEFSFALFDNVHCYNLSTGTYAKINQSENNSFVVIDKELFIFNSKLNTLISPFSNKKISLKIKYKFMYNQNFYDYKSKKSYDLIFASTIDNKKLFLKNNIALLPAITGKINFENYHLMSCTVDNFIRNIGIYILNNDKSITSYNYDGTQSFKINTTDFEKTTEYAIEFKESVHQKFVDFYGFESEFYPEFFSLSDMGMTNSGRFFNRFIDNIQLGDNYFLKKNNSNYILKGSKNIKSTDTEFDNIYHFYNSETLHYIKFTKISTQEEIQLFANHPKINPAILMCPKDVLLKFELLQ
ncbi:hypothetical protein [Flavobacterium sp.]|uniref:hypothetical protein n=1 Tax=Flavobacterium sp. TaxID=239 RepID=UPI00286DD65E|nr:hypothetical protein [Flavobacterium sp.]